jgi:microcin C transport system permease protein
MLYVVILLRTFIEPGFWTLLVIMVVFNWMSITYYMRTEVYREKAREYALAARAAGASTTRIVFKHLLPNCLTPLITFTPFTIIGGITALTALDYLGYGLPPPTPSWGELIEQSLSSSNRGRLWLVLSPFVALSTTLILVTLVGESIREAFDPRRQSRYE